MARLAYHPGYDITFFGIERLHPFDTCKYSRTWKLLTREFGNSLSVQTIKPAAPATRDFLLNVHSAAYLEELKSARSLAKALELAPVALFPSWISHRFLLKPMRLAVQGTVLAARAAMQSGFAANLSGGYHHAKPNAGEGFCVFSDIGLAVHDLRQSGLLKSDDQVAYIDLDAHQGNGVSHVFETDRRVQILDLYNEDIYPRGDVMARDRIDCDLPVSTGCPDTRYLSLLESHLPSFLDQPGNQFRFAIYNAGTDVYFQDPLGGLSLSAEAVLQRDLYVVTELKRRGIPVLMLPSGGYTHQSHQMIYATLSKIFRDVHPLA